MRFGDWNYVNGLRDVMDKITRASELVEQMPCEMHHSEIQAKASEVLELLEAVQQLVRERMLWPLNIAEKTGMYCEQCGLVVYAESYRQRTECPRCGGENWYFITEKFQPGVEFGTVQHECVGCGAVCFGDVEQCPVCGGKLKEVKVE